MKAPFKPQILAVMATLGLAATATAQLQWSSYDSSGNLLSANMASGGDATYGRSVSFVVPPSTQRIYMTKSFEQINLTNAGSFKKVNFSLVADGSLTPPLANRVYGMALFNDPGTPSSAMDDLGFWCNFHSGNPGFEMFYRPSGTATFFQYDSAHKPGAGTTKTGYPTNGVNYGMQFHLNNPSGAGIQIGTSSSTFAAAGCAMTNGNGAVFQTGYINPVTWTTLPVSNFNEFAFMFKNLTTSNVTVTLSGITLVPLNPGIDTNPVDFNGAPGSTAVFSAAINTNSAPTLGYQWYEIAGGVTNALVNGTTASGSVVSGATSNILSFSNAQTGDSGYVFLVVTNTYGSARSDSALLFIANDTAPSIFSLSPTTTNVLAGQNATFTVRASGVPAPVYYWFDNNSSLIQSGSAATTLVISNIQFANAGTYTVTASNYMGNPSTNFSINVYVPACITRNPSNVLVNVGDPVTFSVVEGGCASPAPTYQWYKNGVLISGATATNYIIPSVTFGDIGSYYVVLSNPGGATTSASAKLAIYSTNLVSAPVSPANGASGLCYDTPLYLSFNQTPSVGTTGKIRIFSTADPVTPVDTIDMSLNNASRVQAHSLFPGDSQTFNYYPVVITGTSVAIYPHSGVMSSNQSYYVTMEPGVIEESNGAYYGGFTNPSVWGFSTKTGGPANPTNLVVAADGSGDFLTVQGAVDSIALGNTAPTLISIRNGTYTEIVNISGKHHVTFRGQNRTNTILAYANNALIATSGGSTHSRMSFKVNANDIALENLTLHNTTPQGGGQAEALMIESGAARCIVNNATIKSLQDTILANVNSSQGYFIDSTIIGNFDYIWGGGNLFFTNCVIHTMTNTSGSTSYNLTASRTDFGSTSGTGNWMTPDGLRWSSNGMSFVGCLLEADAGIKTVTLAGANGTVGGLASWINCRIDTNAYRGPINTLSNTYNFWQYGNTDLSGNPAPYTNVVALGGGDARLLAAINATTWLYGWVPQLAPNILSNPTNKSVVAGGPAAFQVSATGVPAPVFQWLRNGTNIADATNATYNITAATIDDAGTYSVIVSNDAGAVLSTSATLTVNRPPVAYDFSMGAVTGIPTTVKIVGGKYVSDPDGDTLVVTNASGATHGTVTTDGVNVTYTGTNGTDDSFTFTVSDGRGGSASATVTVSISGNGAGHNQLGNPEPVGDDVALTFMGIPGYRYAMDWTHSLTPPVVWTPLLTNTAGANGSMRFTNTPSGGADFYRTRYVP